MSFLPQPTAAELAAWLVPAAAVAGFAVYIWKAMRRPKLDVKQPVAVRKWDEYATKEEVSAVASHAAKELSRVEARVEALDGETARGRKDLYTAIDKLGVLLESKSEARAVRTNQRMDDIQKQLGELPLKLFELFNKR
jgi:hypothetical protein